MTRRALASFRRVGRERRGRGIGGRLEAAVSKVLAETSARRRKASNYAYFLTAATKNWRWWRRDGEARRRGEGDGDGDGNGNGGGCFVE